MHLGHLRVIDAARAAGLRTAVVTFDPHPRSVFGHDVELLTTLERRLELFDAAGVDDVVVLEFDETLANLEPTEFAELILRGMGAPPKRIDTGAKVVTPENMATPEMHKLLHPLEK